MPVRTISAEAIKRLHDIAIREYGGAPGLHQENLLLSAAARPNRGWGDIEFFPTLYDKAAALAEAIINFHVFCDGNKRTALLTASAMLQLNGMCLDAAYEEEVQMMLDVEAGRVTVSQLADWLEQNSFPLTSEAPGTL